MCHGSTGGFGWDRVWLREHNKADPRSIDRIDIGLSRRFYNGKSSACRFATAKGSNARNRNVASVDRIAGQPRRCVGAMRKRIERLGLLASLLQFARVEHRFVCAGFGSVDAHADMSGPIVTVSSLPIVRGSVSATPNAEAVPRRT
jgi:hypothetical protein